MKKKIIIFWGISLIYILFFPILKDSVLDRDYYIEFATNGEKCENALGTEIWIDSILVDDKLYDLSQIPLEESGWGYTGRIFNPGEAEGILRTKIPYKRKIEIIFVTHPYSGIVDVTNQMITKEYNLYSEDEGRISCVFER